MPDLVREDTRARILAAARKLGYEPNRAARALITGKTKNIGLIVPDIANPWFPPMIKSAQRHARQADYAVFLADTDEDPGAEPELLNKMSKDVDGVVFLSSRMPDEAIVHYSKVMKIVTINRAVEGVPCVLMDMGDGERQAVDHLALLEHRRIAYVNGPPTSWSNQQQRRAAQLSARRNGLELVVLGPFAPTFEGGVLAADAVLASGVSGVCAFNDLMALGILNRLADRAVLVPEHVSVIGFDNIAGAAASVPALTTVAAPNDAAGRAAVELLLRYIENDGEAVRNRISLPTQLRVRKSTGKPPARLQGGTHRENIAAKL